MDSATAPAHSAVRAFLRTSLIRASGANQLPVRIARGDVAGESPDVGDVGDRIGTAIDDPSINYAKLAESMGWYAEGPIENPKDLGPAIRRALAVVEKGQPALLDTITQPT